MGKAPVTAFIDFVLSKEGCPYVWPTKENGYSGKDLKGALYQDVYDCSGLVTSGLYAATKGKLDWRSDHSAQKLFEECPELEFVGQKPALAFYGPGKNMITHVMLVVPDGRVFGACGRSDSISPAIAEKHGYRVRFQDNPNYRSDLRGFRKIPL